jgi:arylsulfatase A-like enzyme
LHTYEIHDYFYAKPEHVEFFAKQYDGRIKGNFLEFIKDRDIRESFDFSPADLRFMKDSYDGSILYTDRYIGKLIAALKEMNLYEDTLIIITSDHGESFNEPHRDNQWVQWHHGGPPYESQIHIPLIIKLPKSLENQPLVINEPHSLVDIMPTLAELLQLKPANSLQGISMASALKKRGNQTEERVIVTIPAHRDLNAVLGLRTSDYKYITRKDYNIDELYDLRSDPEETINLAGEAELKDKMKEYSRLVEEYLENCEGYKSIDISEEGLPEDLKRELEALGYLR